MKMANIEQSIKFIGMGDTIEIWSSNVASQPFMEPDEFSRALEAIMTTPEPPYTAENITD